MRPVFAFLMLFTVLAVGSAASTAPAAAPGDLEARRKTLSDLLAAQWEYNLSTSPEFASSTPVVVESS